MLTQDQEKALSGILNFLSQPINEFKDCATILYAAAGCGKTFLTRFIVDKLRGKYVIAGVAPTHKARKVLHNFLNNPLPNRSEDIQESSFLTVTTNKLSTIKTMTVAGLLGKLRNHSYIGTHNYVETQSKVKDFQIFIIDEASMISNEDIKKIITYAFDYKRKLIFVGDKYQIPNPVQNYVYEGDCAYKADAGVFNIPGFELTTNIRQKEGNPIIPIYWELRNVIAENREANIDRTSIMKNDTGVSFYTNREEWYEQMKKIYTTISQSEKATTTFPIIRGKANLSKEIIKFSENSTLNNIDNLQLHNYRIIAYTNDAVKTHNNMVRSLFGRGSKPEVGELLMGYNNIGFPEPYVSNGQDYYILDVSETRAHRILDYTNLVGLFIKTKECDSNIFARLFVIDISQKNNHEILHELVKRGEKVNSNYSTKQDYKIYYEIRNRIIFMENIYKIDNEILGETQFRLAHPLLFKNLNEVVNFDKHVVLNNKLTDDILEKYGNILEDRLQDNKTFSEVERVSDRFLVIEKDIDYGYSITAHKAQSTTYKTVFIDEVDFDKLRDRFNYRLGCRVKTVKEKNQLKYVAYTRPTHSAYVFYKEILPE
jgi:hypothetical protein